MEIRMPISASKPLRLRKFAGRPASRPCVDKTPIPPDAVAETGRAGA